MNIRVLRAFLAACAVTGLLMPRPGALAQSSVNPVALIAPSIVSQPASQTVGYASNVVLSVLASGTPPLSYQWRKNGVDLADYDNVAGAQTSTLELVGLAESEAASYTVVVSNDGGAVTSSVAALSIRSSVKFVDDFQSGMTNWQALLDSQPMTLAQLDPNQGGTGFGLLATNPDQKVYHNLGSEYACRVVFTFWMYDDGSGLAACGQVRGYTGPGYGKYVSPGGLWQEFVIGKYNGPFGTNLTAGTLRGATLDTAMSRAACCEEPTRAGSTSMRRALPAVRWAGTSFRSTALLPVPVRAL